MYDAVLPSVVDQARDHEQGDHACLRIGTMEACAKVTPSWVIRGVAALTNIDAMPVATTRIAR